MWNSNKSICQRNDIEEVQACQNLGGVNFLNNVKAGKAEFKLADLTKFQREGNVGILKLTAPKLTTVSTEVGEATNPTGSDYLEMEP